jgi:hypothetical protein
MHSWIINFLILVNSNHKSTVDARESWKWTCPIFSSVICCCSFCDNFVIIVSHFWEDIFLSYQYIFRYLIYCFFSFHTLTFFHFVEQFVDFKNLGNNHDWFSFDTKSYAMTVPWKLRSPFLIPHIRIHSPMYRTLFFCQIRSTLPDGIFSSTSTTGPRDHAKSGCSIDPAELTRFRTRPFIPHHSKYIWAIRSTEVTV